MKVASRRQGWEVAGLGQLGYNSLKVKQTERETVRWIKEPAPWYELPLNSLSFDAPVVV